MRPRKHIVARATVISVLILAAVDGFGLAAQDKYTLQVPMGSRSLNSEDTRVGSLSPSVRTETSWLRPSPIP